MDPKSGSDEHSIGTVANFVLPTHPNLRASHSAQDYESWPEHKFQVVDILGMGGSGIVEKVQDVESGQLYARKRVVIRNGPYCVQTLREPETLRKLRHEHIVSIVYSYQTKHNFYMLLSPVADEDLKRFLDRIETHGVTEEADKRVLCQAFGCLAQGLEFIHRQSIRHIDIKPSNILLKEGQVYFTDFGTAQNHQPTEDTTTGPPPAFTRRYACPQLSYGMPWGSSSDVWSLACVYFEILNALVPKFKASRKSEDDYNPYCERLDEVVASIMLSRSFDPNYTKIFDLCQCMLEFAPLDRPTAKVIVERLKAISSVWTFCELCKLSHSHEERGTELQSALVLKTTDSRSQKSAIVGSIDAQTAPHRIPPLAASKAVTGTASIAFSDSGIDVQSRAAESMMDGTCQYMVENDQDIHTGAARIVAEEDSTSESFQRSSHSTEDDVEGTRQIHGTELTDFDQLSVSSEDSDASLIDLGIQPLPNGVYPDEHLVRTKQWISSLESMEKDVVERSSLYQAQQTHPPQPGWSRFSEVKCGFQRIALNLRTMKEADYIKDRLTAITMDNHREGVARMISISVQDIEDYGAALESQDLAGCLDHLRLWGFEEDYAHILEIFDPRKSFFTITALINWLLDTTIVSFCGAHMEKFNEKYFEGQHQFYFECETGRTLYFRPQHLRCLDGYLRQRPIWVFERSSPKDDRWVAEGLYLSATLRDFNTTWGPVYVTHTSTSSTSLIDSPPEILRFNVGLGWIIPRRRLPKEPPACSDEIFAHYTDDPSDLVDVEIFPRGSQDARLLVGGGLKLSINTDCALPAGLDTYTSYMRDVNLMKAGQVRRPVMVRDTRTVTTQLSAFGVANVGYQETFKIRDGFAFRDQLTADWTNEPDRRNPSILSDWVAVEVSACTENARRRPLAMILGSSTMLNYLDAHMVWEQEESKQLYIEAVTGKHIQALEILYGTRKELRMDIGRAIALCVNALHHTGLDSDRVLRALWCPSQRKSWTAAFHYYDQIGLLKDTSESCVFAALTLNCLEFQDTPDIPVLRCQHLIPGTSPDLPERMNMTSNPTYRGHYTAFETSIVINPKAVVPAGLKHDGKCWKMRRCSPDTELDLGDSGLLKYYGPIHVTGSRRSKGAFVRWSPPPFVRERIQQVRERVLALPRKPCHRELVTEEELEKGKLLRKSLRVHVVAF